jgi:hypothetical protein
MARQKTVGKVACILLKLGHVQFLSSYLLGLLKLSKPFGAQKLTRRGRSSHHPGALVENSPASVCDCALPWRIAPPDRPPWGNHAPLLDKPKKLQ